MKPSKPKIKRPVCPTAYIDQEGTLQDLSPTKARLLAASAAPGRQGQHQPERQGPVSFRLKTSHSAVAFRALELKAYKFASDAYFCVLQCGHLRIPLWRQACAGESSQKEERCQLMTRCRCLKWCDIRVSVHDQSPKPTSRQLEDVRNLVYSIRTRHTCASSDLAERRSLVANNS